MAGKFPSVSAVTAMEARRHAKKPCQSTFQVILEVSIHKKRIVHNHHVRSSSLYEKTESGVKVGHFVYYFVIQCVFLSGLLNSLKLLSCTLSLSYQPKHDRLKEILQIHPFPKLSENEGGQFDSCGNINAIVKILTVKLTVQLQLEPTKQ